MQGGPQGFPRNCMTTYCTEENQGATKQIGPFCKPQEIACETCRPSFSGERTHARRRFSSGYSSPS